MESSRPFRLVCHRQAENGTPNRHQMAHEVPSPVEESIDDGVVAVVTSLAEAMFGSCCSRVHRARLLDMASVEPTDSGRHDPHPSQTSIETRSEAHHAWLLCLDGWAETIDEMCSPTLCQRTARTDDARLAGLAERTASERGPGCDRRFDRVIANAVAIHLHLVGPWVETVSHLVRVMLDVQSHPHHASAAKRDGRVWEIEHRGPPRPANSPCLSSFRPVNGLSGLVVIFHPILPWATSIAFGCCSSEVISLDRLDAYRCLSSVTISVVIGHVHLLPLSSCPMVVTALGLDGELDFSIVAERRPVSGCVDEHQLCRSMECRHHHRRLEVTCLSVGNHPVVQDRPPSVGTSRRPADDHYCPIWKWSHCRQPCLLDDRHKLELCSKDNMEIKACSNLNEPSVAVAVSVAVSVHSCGSAGWMKLLLIDRQSDVERAVKIL